MYKKIQAAFTYVAAHATDDSDTSEVRNDAANIYADSYGEYMMIWDALNAKPDDSRG